MKQVQTMLTIVSVFEAQGRKSEAGFLAAETNLIVQKRLISMLMASYQQKMLLIWWELISSIQKF